MDCYSGRIFWLEVDTVTTTHDIIDRYFLNTLKQLRDKEMTISM
jgi:hypothetical protein